MPEKTWSVCLPFEAFWRWMFTSIAKKSLLTFWRCMCLLALHVAFMRTFWRCMSAFWRWMCLSALRQNSHCCPAALGALWVTGGWGRFLNAFYTRFTHELHELHTQAVGQKILHTPLILHTFYTPRLVNKGACNPRVKIFYTRLPGQVKSLVAILIAAILIR